MFTTSDLVKVLFNAGILTAGIASIFLAVGFPSLLFGEEISFTQPVINFLAGILFGWFAIKEMFFEGDKK